MRALPSLNWSLRRRSTAFAAATILALVGCGGTDRANSQPTNTPTLKPLAPAHPSDIRGCIDPTTSSSEGFAPMVLDEIVDQLRTWPTETESRADTTARWPSRPGLRLTLRQVTTHAYSTEAPVVAIQVPGVSGLPAVPTLDDPELGAKGPEWSRLERTRRGELAAAQEAAEAAARSIEQWPLLRKSKTAVLDCVAAAASNADSTTRLLVASDLFDNASRAARPNTADLRGTAVIVLQSCPAGHEDECDSEFDTFSQWVKQQDGRVLATFRAEEAESAISLWFEEDR